MSVIEDMKRLESVEDFLAYFAIDYDVRVVQVSRLHILKRFHQYLAQQERIEDLAPASAYAVCRSLLERAYADFTASSGVEQKVFKVFHAARGEHRVSLRGVGRAGRN